MIIAGYEYRNKRPFKNVYLTGVVRDNQGKKMSKSLGNSPDPIRLIDQYGADGVRVGMLLCSPAGNDLLFDESLTEQGRNFGNKIWNAFRLIKNWKVDDTLQQPEYARETVEWFKHRLNMAIQELDKQYNQFKLSEALMNIYRLFWEDFSSWYLEIIKPAYQQSIDQKTYELTLEFLEKLMQMLHPIMPFITEESWHLIRKRANDESIMMTNAPVAEAYDRQQIDAFEKVKEIISAVRNMRKAKQISHREALTLKYSGEHVDQYDPVIRKLAHIERIEEASDKLENAVSFMVRTTEYSIPLPETVNAEEEIRKLEEELDYTRGFLHSVMKKLNNRRFVQNAPENVVNTEKKKKEDAEQKITTLEERIKSLKVSR
jgi:valyl-tRNA synthetase